VVVVTVVGVALLALAPVAPARERMEATPSSTPVGMAAGRMPVVQRALDRLVAAGAPGAMAFVRDGDRTVRLSSGYGTLDPDTPMHAPDRFRIGGLTKTFTATVILQLVGEGAVMLDDTLEQWLPGAISNGELISVRQLLNHTSGIYDYAQDPSIFAPYFPPEGDLTLIFDANEGVRIANEHGPLFAPGSALAYSNTNYLLLAMIVEAATGNPFESELRARIFEPLGLDQTSYPDSSEIEGSYIHGYVPGEPPLFDITPLSPTLLGASGAIVSSAEDLADFSRALLRGDLLAPELLRAMKSIDPVATVGIPDSGFPGGGWGLGLLRQRFPCGRKAWGHDSEIPGYTTASWSNRSGTRQVVVVVNSFFAPDSDAAGAIRDVLAGAYCRPWHA
jgi:D-alanyl-D-alanine carboxypeptidase